MKLPPDCHRTYRITASIANAAAAVILIKQVPQAPTDPHNVETGAISADACVLDRMGRSVRDAK